MGCRQTFSLSAKVTRYARRRSTVSIRSHVLAGLPVRASTAPSYDKDSDEEQSECEEVPDGEVDANGWRRAYRQREPEKEGVGLKKMRQAFDSQRVAGVVMTARRKLWKDRCGAACATANKAKQNAASARKALQDKRKSDKDSSASSSASPPNSNSSETSASDHDDLLV